MKLKTLHFMPITSSKAPSYLLFISKLYATTIGVFLLFRIVLFAMNNQLWSGETFAHIAESFMVGLRYDNVIIAYIMAVPILFFFIVFLSGKSERFIIRFTGIWFYILSGFAFLISCGDIPFFQFYNSRVTVTILSWTDKPMLMLKAVFTNWHFVLYLLVGIGLLFLWYKFISILMKKAIEVTKQKSVKFKIFSKIGIVLLISVFLFFSIRGQINLKYMPIGIKNAYFCDNAFLNQLGLNPTYTFLKSFGDDKIELMDLGEAYKYASNELNINSNDPMSIRREIRFDSLPQKMNVIVVLMESMSANQMGYYGNTRELTPFLDTLAKKSLFFPNTYSSGIHTFNGIFSTLYGLPAMLGRNPMTNVSSSNQKFDGLPVQLQQNGYQTMFFCPNNKDFDNLGSFLTSNGIQNITSEEDYPSDKIANGWGVGDDFLFENGIHKINQIEQNKPFFAAFLTVSTHTPHVIPKNIPFKPTAEKLEDQIYQYADWSIQKLMTLASQQKWYSNTIFIFVADHGQNFDPTYEMPLSYHHIPLIFFAPGKIEARIDERFALQTDIFPTIMGFLRIPYTNNSPGLDLVNDKARPFAYFSADNKIGVVDSTFFYIWHKSGRENLYQYKTRNKTDVFTLNQNRVSEMKKYAFSFLQITDDLFKKRSSIDKK